MKDLMFLVVVVMMVASACVAQEETDMDASAQLDPADHGNPDDPGAMGSASVQATPPISDDGPVPSTPPTSSEFTSDNNLVHKGHVSREGRCGPPLVSVLEQARAFRLDHLAIDVEVHGRIHTGADTPGRFTFAVLTEEGQDISGRSWPEVEWVDIQPDGSFSMRVRAAGCSDYTDARRIAITFYDDPYTFHSNTLEMDIEEPQRYAPGESCSAFGSACVEGSQCSAADHMCQPL